jgi:hypothetical protein
MWNLWWTKCTGTGFFREFRFPLPILIPPTARHSSSIVLGWYNRSVRGRRTKWTQSHSTSKKLKKKFGNRWKWVVNFTLWPFYSDCMGGRVGPKAKKKPTTYAKSWTHPFSILIEIYSMNEKRSQICLRSMRCFRYSRGRILRLRSSGVWRCVSGRQMSPFHTDLLHPNS